VDQKGSVKEFAINFRYVLYSAICSGYGTAGYKFLASLYVLIRRKEISKMKKYFLGAVLILGIMCIKVHPAFPAQVNMHEGKWQITMETKMEGLPFQVPVVPYTTTQCITKDDLVPRNRTQKDQRCEIIDQKISGNKVMWKVKCTHPDGTSEGQGEITYRGDSYSGRMTTKIVDNKTKQVMTSVTTMKGRRIGDCSK
jgi:hypothetical protein